MIIFRRSVSNIPPNTYTFLLLKLIENYKNKKETLNERWDPLEFMILSKFQPIIENVFKRIYC